MLVPVNPPAHRANRICPSKGFATVGSPDCSALADRGRESSPFRLHAVFRFHWISDRLGPCLLFVVPIRRGLRDWTVGLGHDEGFVCLASIVQQTLMPIDANNRSEERRVG